MSNIIKAFLVGLAGLFVGLSKGSDIDDKVKGGIDSISFKSFFMIVIALFLGLFFGKTVKKKI